MVHVGAADPTTPSKFYLVDGWVKDANPECADFWTAAYPDPGIEVWISPVPKNS